MFVGKGFETFEVTSLDFFRRLDLNRHSGIANDSIHLDTCVGVPVALDKLRIRGNMMTVLLREFHLKYCFLNSIFNQNRVQKIRIISDMAKY